MIPIQADKVAPPLQQLHRYLCHRGPNALVGSVDHESYLRALRPIALIDNRVEIGGVNRSRSRMFRFGIRTTDDLTVPVATAGRSRCSAPEASDHVLHYR